MDPTRARPQLDDGHPTHGHGTSAEGALPVIALANRLPVVRGADGWRAAPGGLVTALRPALQSRTSAWVGWSGSGQAPERRVPGLDVDLQPVGLSRRQVDGHYHGFSNRTLWPLLHDLLQPMIVETGWWQAYREVNERFAAAAADVRLPGSEAPILWVHDYHLMLLPRLLRAARPGSPIAFFLHTPFPAPELFARLPWRSELLTGMLGADAVAFHTDPYRDNFLRACRQILPGVRVVADRIVLPDGRDVQAVVRPVSIDAAELEARASSETVGREVARLRSRFRGRAVLLGADRLDYTKGILERLRALELLLERRPDLRRRIAFVQLAVPSRDHVKEYRDLRADVEREVGRINGRFTEPGGDVPVHYLYRNVSQDRLLAHYLLADVALVTPLKDGMNLVAKEFVATQAGGGGTGVLILSEFAGAANELREALLCNPFDVEALVRCIDRALDMEPSDRRARLAAMARTIRRGNVFAWAEASLEDAVRARRRRSPRPLEVRAHARTAARMPVGIGAPATFPAAWPGGDIA